MPLDLLRFLSDATLANLAVDYTTFRDEAQERLDKVIAEQRRRQEPPHRGSYA